jgi:hypothetical protein
VESLQNYGKISRHKEMLLILKINMATESLPKRLIIWNRGSTILSGNFKMFGNDNSQFSWKFMSCNPFNKIVYQKRKAVQTSCNMKDI